MCKERHASKRVVEDRDRPGPAGERAAGRVRVAGELAHGERPLPRPTTGYRGHIDEFDADLDHESDVATLVHGSADREREPRLGGCRAHRLCGGGAMNADEHDAAHGCDRSTGPRTGVAGLLAPRQVGNLAGPGEWLRLTRSGHHLGVGVAPEARCDPLAVPARAVTRPDLASLPAEALQGAVVKQDVAVHPAAGWRTDRAVRSSR